MMFNIYYELVNIILNVYVFINVFLNFVNESFI